jgi:hypothetical protein
MVKNVFIILCWLALIGPTAMNSCMIFLETHSCFHLSPTNLNKSSPKLSAPLNSYLFACEAIQFHSYLGLKLTANLGRVLSLNSYHVLPILSPFLCLSDNTILSLERSMCFPSPSCLYNINYVRINFHDF